MKCTASGSNIKDIGQSESEGSQDVSTGIEIVVSSANKLATNLQSKEDETAESLLFGDMTEEHFVDYLLSGNESFSEDQQNVDESDEWIEAMKKKLMNMDQTECFLDVAEESFNNCLSSVIELQSEAIKINCSIGYEDVLDETEGSYDEDLMDLFLNNSHQIEERNSEESYKELRYIFDIDEFGVPYIANMSEIIPPNFMDWYEKMEKEQEKTVVSSADKLATDLQPKKDETAESLLFGDITEEQFVDYLLSGNESFSEDQQNVDESDEWIEAMKKKLMNMDQTECFLDVAEESFNNCLSSVIELQSEAIKINCSIGYEDVLDETEGSYDEDLMDLFLNNSHQIEERNSEESYKELRYIFDIDEFGVPYIANMSEIIPPNFMDWYEKMEKEQEKTVVSSADKLATDLQPKKDETAESLLFGDMTEEQFVDYLLSGNESFSEDQTKVDESGSFLDEEEGSSIAVQSICQSFETSEHEPMTEFQYEIEPGVKKSSILARIKMSAASIFCCFRGNFEDLKEPTSRSIFYV